MNLEFKGLVGRGITAVFKQWQGTPPTTQFSYLTSFLCDTNQIHIHLYNSSFTPKVCSKLFNVTTSPGSLFSVCNIEKLKVGLWVRLHFDRNIQV